MSCRKFLFLIALPSLLIAVGCGRYSSNVEWDSSPEKEEDVETDELSDTGGRIPVRATIRVQKPIPGEVICDDVYNETTGITHRIPDDLQVVCFVSDTYNYFLCFPFAIHNRQSGHFQQRNVRLATEGDDWQLHVCLATREAAAYLFTCARRSQWDFAALPAGVRIIESVPVQRQKR